MSRAGLRAAKPDARADSPIEPISLSPLSISGVVVSKSNLVEALRIYVPLINGIEPLGDGNHFLITLDSARQFLDDDSDVQEG